jgi:flagellar hook-associated protein 3 FlgL
VDTLAASARSALTQVAGLLNTTDGNVYVFSGQDTANPAVPDGDNILSSGFYTQINAAVTALSASGAAATAASTLATASSNAAGTSPFSAFLSQGAAGLQKQRSIVPLGDGSSEQTGLLASANAAVVSSGSSTTGSYMRDLMRALATIGSLSSSQLGDSTNFNALVSDTRTSLHGAIGAMADDAGVLGVAEARFTADKAQIGDMQAALKSQLSSAQEVDMASTLSQLTAVQTQMQASYQLIAGLSGLSLTKFLP